MRPAIERVPGETRKAARESIDIRIVDPADLHKPK
jgi:hypothetical protein